MFVGVASIPSREKSLKKVIDRLLPQARQIGVYLNGYDKVPLFLRRSSRIVVARSQDHGDLRDNGKFFFVDKSDARYYATVDDDLLYPGDYLRHLVETLNETDQRSAVGVHGAIYPSPIVELFDPRILIHFEDPLPHVMPVHLLGTGTALFDQSNWKLELSEFGRPGMADVWFAAAAAKRDASLFVARRVRNWVTAIDRFAEGKKGGALFFEGLLDSSSQVSVLNDAEPATGAFEHLVTSLLDSARFSEDFSLHQAMHLDLIRTQLGYPPLSDEAARGTSERLQARARRWSEDHVLTADEARSLGQQAVDVLSNRVASSSLEPVLELLDRLHQLAVHHPIQWVRLPVAVRFDSSPERVETLESGLLERGVERSDDDARRLWSAFEGRSEFSLSAALQAERASIRTGFERLPALLNLARENPDAAAARLYDYFEATDWKRHPDLAGLRMAFGPEYESLDVQMLVCVAAARSGNEEHALRTMASIRQRWPWDRDVHLMEASFTGPREGTPIEVMRSALEVLDQALVLQGISPPYLDLIRHDADGSHWIHHLGRADDAQPPAIGSAPMVSVVMTTYNDADIIGPAIRSILSSRGVDLQLIVVDDASTDDTVQRVTEIDDERVTVLRNEANAGPYVSRNRALEHATGRYVAIADADDWSHPQRLQYQSSILEASPHLVACKVAHVRIRPNGLIDLENHLRFLGDGPMSLMFRRWLIDHIGGFDHVRTRGDIEYQRRITARFGETALASFETPLVLATSSAKSNSKRFREEDLNIYRTSARRWHEQRALSDALFVPLIGDRAPFMAPYDLLANRHRQE